MHQNPGEANQSADRDHTPLPSNEQPVPDARLSAIPFRNPLLFRDAPADLRHYQTGGFDARHFDEHGQPVIRLPEGLKLFHISDPKILIETNREHTCTPAEQCLTSVFANPARTIGAKVTQAYAYAGVSGFYRKSEDGKEALHPGRLGDPLRCMDVGFVIFPEKYWRYRDLGELAHPLKSTKQGSIIPFVGGVYLEGQPLENVAQQASQVVVEDREGRRLHPLFVRGNRNLIVIAPLLLPIRQVNEGGVEFVPPEELPQYLAIIKASGPEGRMLTALGVEYSGVGTPRYVCHVVSRDGLDRVELRPGERIVKGQDLLPEREPLEIVQRECYAGKSGIFLDLQAMPGKNGPSGGRSDGREALAQDQLLLRHGARMAAVAYDYLPLFRRDDLEAHVGRPLALPVDETGVLAKALLDDTHPLGTISTIETTGEAGCVSPIVAELLTIEYGACNERTREAYVRRLCENVGHNLRVALTCGYTLPIKARSDSYLNVYGLLMGGGSLQPMEHRLQCASLIREWLQDVERAAAAAGFDGPKFYRSGPFRRFIHSFLDRDHASAAIRHIHEAGRTLPGLVQPVLLCLRLGALWVKQCMSSEGKAFIGEDLLRVLRHEPDLQMMLELAEDDQEQLERLEREGLPPVVTLKGRGGATLVMPKETFLNLLVEAYLFAALDMHSPIMGHLAGRDPGFLRVREVPL